MTVQNTSTTPPPGGWEGFIDMGGYAAYVWPAYGLVLLVLAGLLWFTLHGLRDSENMLRILQGGQGDTRPKGTKHNDDVDPSTADSPD